MHPRQYGLQLLEITTAQKKLCPYSPVFHNEQRVLGKGRIKDMIKDVQLKISIDTREMRYKTIRVSDAQWLLHYITQQSKRNQETNYP